MKIQSISVLTCKQCEFSEFTYKPDEDAEQLDDVSVGDAVKATKKRVEYGNAGAQDDAGPVVHVDDNTKRSTCEQISHTNSMLMSHGSSDAFFNRNPFEI